MLVPIFKLEELSFIVWPFILLVDLLAIALAVLTATLLPVLAVLLLTLAATGALIFKIPADLTGLPTSFFLLGAFAVFFVAASVWLARKFKPDALEIRPAIRRRPQAPTKRWPRCCPRAPPCCRSCCSSWPRCGCRWPNPSPVFGLALLLVVLLLGVTKLFSFDWMPAVGLVCVTALECAWHFNRFDPANSTSRRNAAGVVSGFLRRRSRCSRLCSCGNSADKTFPWAAAAHGRACRNFSSFTGS